MPRRFCFKLVTCLIMSNCGCIGLLVAKAERIPLSAQWSGEIVPATVINPQTHEPQTISLLRVDAIERLQWKSGNVRSRPAIGGMVLIIDQHFKLIPFSHWRTKDVNGVMGRFLPDQNPLASYDRNKNVEITEFNLSSGALILDQRQ